MNLLITFRTLFSAQLIKIYVNSVVSCYLYAHQIRSTCFNCFSFGWLILYTISFLFPFGISTYISVNHSCIKAMYIWFRNTWSHLLKNRSTLPKEMLKYHICKPWTYDTQILNADFNVVCFVVCHRIGIGSKIFKSLNNIFS